MNTSVLPRYPANIELVESDGKIALKYSARIVDFVNEIIVKLK